VLRGAYRLGLMLYMVIEHYKDGAGTEVYRRFRDHGRMAPAGLEYLASWVETDYSRCFQVMQTDDRALLEEWMAHWRDLVDFEVRAVLTSAEAAAAIAPRL
jgi:hypothetical protein